MIDHTPTTYQFRKKISVLCIIYCTLSSSLISQANCRPCTAAQRNKATLARRTPHSVHVNALAAGSNLSKYLPFPREGDVLPDYSYAGYAAGSLPIPNVVAVFATLQPKDDQSDRTSDIQNAIDGAAQTPGGGVVQLEGGDYWLSSDSSLRLPSSVILRGEASIPSRTIIHATGTPRTLIEVGDAKAEGKPNPSEGNSVISQAYVPLGATDAEVQDATGFRVGQSIVVQRAVTSTWLEAMKMNDLVRNGKKESWLSVGTSVQQEREITAIDGNRIRWAVPLTDPVDSTTSDNNATITAFKPTDRVRQAAIENIVLNQDPSATHLPVGTKTILPIMIGAAEDCWVKNVQATGFLEFAYFNPSSRRITMQDFVITKDQPTANGGKGALPLDITLGGSQALLLRGKTVGDENTASYIVATARLAMGPNVISDYTALGSTRHIIEPHQRWSTGLLVERARVGQINLKNRGILGSGHGWSMGAGVIWSSIATKLLVEDPPTSENYVVNSRPIHKLTAELETDEKVDTNDPATSLYHLQLQARVEPRIVQQIMGTPLPTEAVTDTALPVSKP
ncbi:hypothetical protein CROQUDRAFT_658952 [Cronartium quercuum f. sp. fusiforme G11]|uniref:Pectate lyase superfamily protein domain-containing protein n=1 Tax=Cronartium quercuum f. sp. fusiforme G11 TaxID=708437 RepID=A0A9P6TAI7_9BASI|nr:hypothetical protein CROQUDRAFT_658952 [Cronartium quercuum f. sp. fusiforme G11]